VTESVTELPVLTDWDTGCTEIVGADTVVLPELDPLDEDDDPSPPQPDTNASAAATDTIANPLTIRARMPPSPMTLNMARMVEGVVSRDIATWCRGGHDVNGRTRRRGRRGRSEVPGISFIRARLQVTAMALLAEGRGAWRRPAAIRRQAPSAARRAADDPALSRRPGTAFERFP
jgi:hypothetical protein